MSATKRLLEEIYERERLVDFITLELEEATYPGDLANDDTETIRSWVAAKFTALDSCSLCNAYIVVMEDEPDICGDCLNYALGRD